MTDGVDAFHQRDPCVAGAGRSRKSPARLVGGRDRVLCEGVQDVGEQQFLVLLLMIETDLNQRLQLRQRVGVR
jgi:hypothetical protein